MDTHQALDNTKARGQISDISETKQNDTLSVSHLYHQTYRHRQHFSIDVHKAVMSQEDYKTPQIFINTSYVEKQYL